MKRYFQLWRLVLSVLALVFCTNAFAQVKADTAKPVFTASMGMYNGTTKTLGTDVKKLVANNPTVKVKDAKSVEYKVIGFELTWKRKEMSDDVKTGKPKTVFYMVGTDVKGNQLPDIFRQQIGTSLQAGEEIMLGNILYYDPKKKVNAKAGNNITLNIL